MANKTITLLTVSSPAFLAEGVIPNKYTCDGLEVNPPLKIGDIPEGTQTLAIVVEDPDAPKGTFDHWIVWNIPPTGEIAEDTMPGIGGENGAGTTGYHGPCPPEGYHRYYFQVFALDTTLDLPAGENKAALQEAMQSHILAQGSLMGRYQRVNKTTKAVS